MFKEKGRYFMTNVFFIIWNTLQTKVGSFVPTCISVFIILRVFSVYTHSDLIRAFSMTKKSILNRQQVVYLVKANEWSGKKLGEFIKLTSNRWRPNKKQQFENFQNGILNSTWNFQVENNNIYCLVCFFLSRHSLQKTKT